MATRRTAGKARKPVVAAVAPAPAVKEPDLECPTGEVLEAQAQAARLMFRAIFQERLSARLHPYPAMIGAAAALADMIPIIAKPELHLAAVDELVGVVRKAFDQNRAAEQARRLATDAPAGSA
jgi:hypothetical protein